ncbi:MAG: hypoxanthine phosphoribosyltransferase [Clostridia bacterium]|nr:hypoxanthine phosphoribosyltransferase [Clostridia bacterium]
MHPDCAEILIGPEELQKKVKELGKILTEEYRGKDLIVLGLLKGSFVFMSDLVRAMDLDLDVEFMVVSSYGASTQSSGNIKINLDLKADLTGKHVLIVEDILDTGRTLYNIRDIIRLRGPESVKICTLLDKPARRKTDIKADFVGFTVEDKFIIGYGLDYAEKYRNLPYIGVLRPEIYQ